MIRTKYQIVKVNLHNAGSVFVCVCALFLMELEHGWRLELTAILAVTLLTLFFLHFIDESPRYFAITGFYRAHNYITDYQFTWLKNTADLFLLLWNILNRDNSFSSSILWNILNR